MAAESYTSGNSSQRDKIGGFTADVGDPGGFFHKNSNKQADMPPPPDFIGAAREQGAQNIALAKVNATLNNPNVNGILGKQAVTFDANGIPTINRTVVPGLQGATSALLGQVGRNMTTPLDFSGATDLQNKVQEAILSRLEPQFQRDEDSMRTRLANQGIGMGSEAYNKDIDTFNRSKTDARLQAVLSAFQATPQALQQEAFIKSAPWNALQSIASGAQMQLPQFATGGNAKAGDFQGAAKQASDYATDVYNAQQAQAAQNKGLLSSAGLAALAFL